MDEKKKKAQLVLRELRRFFPEAKTILHYSNNLELLIAVMLSAQTTDIQVNKVTDKLFNKYKNLSDYQNATLKEFEKDISSIGLYRGKAKNILAMVTKLQKDFGGEIPSTLEELMTLPGVGRKTANVVLSVAYGVCEGIAVDTHVTRLAQKFGLTSYSDPKKIEQDLMKILPQNEWRDFTLRMIDYGRKYSPARKTLQQDPISQKLQNVFFEKKEKR